MPGCLAASLGSGTQAVGSGSGPARRWILAAVAGITCEIMHPVCGQEDIPRASVLHLEETWVVWFSSCSFPSTRNHSQLHSWKHLPTSWGSYTGRNWMCLVTRAVPLPLCSLPCSGEWCHCHCAASPALPALAISFLYHCKIFTASSVPKATTLQKTHQWIVPSVLVVSE